MPLKPGKTEPVERPPSSAPHRRPGGKHQEVCAIDSVKIELVLYQRRESLKAEFTAIIESAPEGGYWATCPEVPGANGQGETPQEAKDSLRQAIELILEDRTADALRGLPDDVIREKVIIE